MSMTINGGNKGKSNGNGNRPIGGSAPKGSPVGIPRKPTPQMKKWAAIKANAKPFKK